MTQNRRTFLGALASLTAASLLPGTEARATNQAAGAVHFATNEYAWITFYKRQGRDWFSNLEASFRDLVKAGITGLEPSVQKPEDLNILAPLLRKHKIEMRSIYVGCNLHKEIQAQKSLEQVTSIAKAARPLGVKIIVTNPDPIRWGGHEDKSDDELRIQATNLDRLGAALRQQGLTLAYHNHDIEMRQSAREFHHMLGATDPRNVSLCLEAHWLYRGAGNSELAMFDILRLYHHRIAEVHLRQSKNGIWTETFGEGDLDYPKLARELAALRVRPHLVLEQCVETQTPHTLDAVAAHQISLPYASQVFGPYHK